MEYLQPEKIHFIKNEDELLQLNYAGEIYKSIRLKRCFPLKLENKYIAVITQDDKEIGVIRNLSDLTKNDYALADEELKERYFVPTILRIKKMKEKGHLHYFDIETDAGDKKIAVQDIIYKINQFANKTIITDVDGNVYAFSESYLQSSDKYVKFIKSYI